MSSVLPRRQKKHSLDSRGFQFFPITTRSFLWILEEFSASPSPQKAFSRFQKISVLPHRHKKLPKDFRGFRCFPISTKSFLQILEDFSSSQSPQKPSYRFSRIYVASHIQCTVQYTRSFFYCRFQRISVLPHHHKKLPMDSRGVQCFPISTKSFLQILEDFSSSPSPQEAS